jgi:hypothetical protein
VAGGDGVVNHVCCKVCTVIEGKERILAAKLNSLCKRTRRKKAKANHLGMVEGTFYYYKNFVHQKMKPCMLVVFIAMWFINWIWGRLGKRKIKRSNLLLCSIC